MPLVTMAQLLASTTSGAVGAFNVVTLEHAEAIVAGAERAGRGVVAQISHNTATYHGSLAPVAEATLTLARATPADVCVHLDHATDPDLVEQAISLGLRSVMFDASALPPADNVAATAQVVQRAHARGVWVEAELGEVGGKDGVHSPTARTDPHDALEYVAATGVDALAVAVGSSHAMANPTAVLDTPLIGRLAGAVPVPLVLHGSSGVPDDGLVDAVRAGMRKVNIATSLNKVFTNAIRLVLQDDPKVSDPRNYLRPARAAMTGEIARLVRLLSVPPA